MLLGYILDTLVMAEIRLRSGHFFFFAQQDVFAHVESFYDSMRPHSSTLNCNIKSDSIKELCSRAIIENFTRQMVDPILNTEGHIIGTVGKAPVFGEEAADQSILLLICAAFPCAVRMCILYHERRARMV